MLECQLCELQSMRLIKKKFYFVRHGKTDWNNKNLCQGQIDIPLNQSGKEEVERLCPLLKNLSFAKIYTSPLIRAHETARIIQTHCLCPLSIVDELKERSWGLLEGATSADQKALKKLFRAKQSMVFPL